MKVTNKIAFIAFVSSLLLVTANQVTYCQSPPPTDPYVYVLVWDWQYGPLSPAISTYKQDLENAGFSVEIRFRSRLPDNAEDIRGLLQNEASINEIAGVLLVGDVPHITYKMGTEPFPCDLYYMDLDGNWTDSDGDGLYDMHGNETGDLEPEIWVGRLWASTVNGSESELLLNYFDKNHRFRTGELALPRRSLAFIDDHALACADEINASLRMIYGNETALVVDQDATSATNYKNALNDTLGYEWLHLEAHGNFKKHAFNTSQGWTYVYSSDVRSIDPHALFYNLMACDTADYSGENYVGGSYVFADTYGLLAVSSTKMGTMSKYSEFYEPVSKGKCIGQAFKEWFEKNGELNRYGYYGLTILGDPALRVPRTYNQTRNLAVVSVTAGDSLYNATEVYSSWAVAINVTLRNEGVFVETINVSAYCGNNTIEKQCVNVFPGADRVVTFIWYIAEVPTCRNYSISAYAHPVSNETNAGDNMGVDGKIYVRLSGDVSGEGMVTGLDVLMVTSIANFMKTAPPADVYADVSGDGMVTGLDVLLITSIENFMKACS